MLASASTPSFASARFLCDGGHAVHRPDPSADEALRSERLPESQEGPKACPRGDETGQPVTACVELRGITGTSRNASRPPPEESVTRLS